MRIQVVKFLECNRYSVKIVQLFKKLNIFPWFFQRYDKFLRQKLLVFFGNSEKSSNCIVLMVVQRSFQYKAIKYDNSLHLMDIGNDLIAF